MGDFRFSLKAKFSMGDVEDECDMWLNWSPDEMVDPYIDRRVLEWLRKNFEAGVDDIRTRMSEADYAYKERKRVEEEDRILAEADEIRARRASREGETGEKDGDC